MANLKRTDLDFSYPKELIAVEPSRPTRVAFCASGHAPVELNMEGLLERFSPGDLLVLNESRVTPARVFSLNQDEILFLRNLSETEWEVLFPSRAYQVGDQIPLPGEITATLERKGLPQVLRVSTSLGVDYFSQYGEMALPPYIQEARGERHNRNEDRNWYQSAWANQSGSVAAPTASLHFSNVHLEALQSKGVKVEKLTLHVGAGTFMPIRSDNIDDHEMHSEQVEVPMTLVSQIEQTKAQKKRVWALGTTSARSLESLAQNLLTKTPNGFVGSTKLFIKPPYEFQMVDVLLTNFHQPQSTLLCLVAAFAGLENVKSTYQWAIDNKFKLFSYGDLSVWCR